MSILLLIFGAVCLAFMGYYLHHINRVYLTCPPEATSFSSKRWTKEEIKQAYEQYLKSPIAIADYLPPKTGNRYIVVGGSGFLGGWIILHLLQRGEDPNNIRIFDIKPPTRSDLTRGPASQVGFYKVDITDPSQVKQAFAASWPGIPSDSSQLTVIHTVSVMRYFERKESMIPFSSKINVEGTQVLLDAACENDVSYFIYTSSGSVLVKPTRLWPLPWESLVKRQVQVFTDESVPPIKHSECVSNYTYTKVKAEGMVGRYHRRKTASGKLLRTGCIRPGNMIYGAGGDPAFERYLRTKISPTWVQNTLQSQVYVENVSVAHLVYEQRLIEDASNRSIGSQANDIGGQAFIVTDPNPAVTFSDVYLAMETLTKGETSFQLVPPVVIFLLAHLVELYHNTRHSIFSICKPLSAFLPPLGSDIINLQPSIFTISSLHLIFDDKRVRLSPERGGLGLRTPFTTLQGICKLVHPYVSAEADQKVNGLSGPGYGIVGAETGVEHLEERFGIEKKR